MLEPEFKGCALLNKVLPGSIMQPWAYEIERSPFYPVLTLHQNLEPSKMIRQKSEWNHINSKEKPIVSNFNTSVEM